MYSTFLARAASVYDWVQVEPYNNIQAIALVDFGCLELWLLITGVSLVPRPLFFYVECLRLYRRCSSYPIQWYVYEGYLNFASQCCFFSLVAYNQCTCTYHSCRLWHCYWLQPIHWSSFPGWYWGGSNIQVFQSLHQPLPRHVPGKYIYYMYMHMYMYAKVCCLTHSKI